MVLISNLMEGKEVRKRWKKLMKTQSRDADKNSLQDLQESSGLEKDVVNEVDEAKLCDKNVVRKNYERVLIQLKFKLGSDKREMKLKSLRSKLDKKLFSHAKSRHAVILSRRTRSAKRHSSNRDILFNLFYFNMMLTISDLVMNDLLYGNFEALPHEKSFSLDHEASLQILDMEDNAHMWPDHLSLPNTAPIKQHHYNRIFVLVDNLITLYGYETIMPESLCHRNTDNKSNNDNEKNEMCSKSVHSNFYKNSFCAYVSSCFYYCFESLTTWVSAIKAKIFTHGTQSCQKI